MPANHKTPDAEALFVPSTSLFFTSLSIFSARCIIIPILQRKSLRLQRSLQSREKAGQWVGRGWWREMSSPGLPGSELEFFHVAQLMRSAGETQTPSSPPGHELLEGRNCLLFKSVHSPGSQYRAGLSEVQSSPGINSLVFFFPSSSLLSDPKQAPGFNTLTPP